MPNPNQPTLSKKCICGHSAINHDQMGYCPCTIPSCICKAWQATPTSEPIEQELETIMAYRMGEWFASHALGDSKAVNEHTYGFRDDIVRLIHQAAQTARREVLDQVESYQAFGTYGYSGIEHKLGGENIVFYGELEELLLTPPQLNKSEESKS